MVATELILGMEELVNHIRDLEVKIQNFEKNETVREARVQELYEENKKLKEELLQQKKIAFWRMAEAYAGYDENTCIHDDDWCNEVKEAMEEYYGSGGEELGSIDELLEEYKNWIGYYEEPDSE